MPGVTVTGPGLVPPAAGRPSTAVHSVADRLRDAIVHGDRAPGTPLVESELCASLGVSRNTVREALRQLSAEGLATYAPHRGCVVAQLSETDAIDIYRVRRLLEVQAVLRAEVVPTRTLEALAAATDALEATAARRDWLGFVAADLRFHAHLVGLLGSRRLDEMVAGTARELMLALSIVDRKTLGMAAAVAEQREILTLLADGRRTDCAALLERHLDDAAALLVATLREQRRPPRPRRRQQGEPE